MFIYIYRRFKAAKICKIRYLQYIWYNIQDNVYMVIYYLSLLFIYYYLVRAFRFTS